MKLMTKHILAFCLIILLLGCNQVSKKGNREGKLSKWPTTHNLEADSIVKVLEEAFDNGESDENIDKMTLLLEDLSRNDARNEVLFANYKYWEARHQLRQGNIYEGNRAAIDGISRLDSARNTYIFFKLRSLLERSLPEIDKRYRFGMENIKYFRSINDSLSVAHSLLTVGHLLRVIGETGKARESFEEASDIWRKIGKDRNYINNQINIALCLKGEEADSLNEILIATEQIRKDTAAYTLILRNMATSALSAGRFDRALQLAELGLEIIDTIGKFEANSVVLNSVKGKVLLHQGNKPEALKQARLALAQSNKPVEKYAEFEVIYNVSEIFKECGLPDSAFILMKKALDIRTDNDFELNNITLGIEEGRQEFMQLEFDSKIRAVRYKLWLAIAAALLVILTFMALYLSRKIKLKRLKEKGILNELKDTQTRLARETLMFEQNESFIDMMKKEIEKERNRGEISQNAASQLLSMLSLQITDRIERKTFTDIHDHLFPGYSVSLKADYPDLTEHQVKLATYITAGLSNNIIAKIFNITPASVRTMRYRLRNKFGLKREDSLEDFLRRYSDKK